MGILAWNSIGLCSATQHEQYHHPQQHFLLHLVSRCFDFSFTEILRTTEMRAGLEAWFEHVTRCPQSLRQLTTLLVGLFLVATALTLTAKLSLERNASVFSTNFFILFVLRCQSKFSDFALIHLCAVLGSLLLFLDIAALWTLTLLLVNSLFVSYIFMPAQILTSLKRDVISRARSRVMSTMPTASCVRIEGEGGELDAVIIKSAAYDTIPVEKHKWIVFLCANGTCLEEYLRPAYTMTRDLSLLRPGLTETLAVNALCLNFRGVGGSEGRVLSARDLVADSLAAMKYLMNSHRTQPDNILLLGHSIGGAAAVIARTKYPHGPVVSNRSFSTLLSVVNLKLQLKPLGAGVGALVLMLLTNGLVFVLNTCGVLVNPMGLVVVELAVLLSAIFFLALQIAGELFVCSFIFSKCKRTFDLLGIMFQLTQNFKYLKSR
jgi:hypothetical protein